MRNSKILSTIIISLLIMGLLSGCGGKQNQSAKDNDEIVIGIFLPMTGQNAAGGQMSMEGINLALEQKGEVLGKKIKTILVDDKSDKVEAANAVTRLIDKEKAVAIIGSYASYLAIPGSEVANKAKIPMMANTSTNPLVTLNKEYVFRSCFIDPLQGTALANFATEQLDAKTAMIILDRANDYSVGLANYFKEAFEKATDSKIEELKYNSGDQDFSAQLTVVKSKNPDILFIPAGNYGDAGLIAKQARDLGINSAFMGGDTWDTPEFAQIGGAAIEGSYFSTHFDPEQTSESAKIYCDLFNKKYEKPSSSAAALSFDAYMLVVDAIEKAGSTEPEAIKNALAGTKDYQGVTGVFNFDENNNPVKDVVIERIKDGKFRFLTSVRPH